MHARITRKGEAVDELVHHEDVSRETNVRSIPDRVFTP
jgi:hypothetical protein